MKGPPVIMWFMQLWVAVTVVLTVVLVVVVAGQAAWRGVASARHPRVVPLPPARITPAQRIGPPAVESLLEV